MSPNLLTQKSSITAEAEAVEQVFERYTRALGGAAHDGPAPQTRSSAPWSA